MVQVVRKLLLLWLLLAAAAAHAQEFPKLAGRVTDAASLLDPAQEADLTGKLEALETSTGRQLVVATVPDLQGHPIEDYGYRLGRAWGIGTEANNDGAILLVAPAERQVRVEVGYGLEPILTDALSSIIIRETILPRFRAGDMAGGIVAGTDAILEQLRLPEAEAQARQAQIVGQAEQRGRSGGGNGIAGIFWIVVFLFIILPALFRGRRGQRYRRGRGPVVLWGPGLGGGWGGGGGGSWGGGGGGGFGGFSGGGGGFGGGGASGGW